MMHFCDISFCFYLNLIIFCTLCNVLSEIITILSNVVFKLFLVFPNILLKAVEFIYVGDFLSMKLKVIIIILYLKRMSSIIAWTCCSWRVKKVITMPDRQTAGVTYYLLIKIIIIIKDLSKRVMEMLCPLCGTRL